MAKVTSCYQSLGLDYDYIAFEIITFKAYLVLLQENGAKRSHQTIRRQKQFSFLFSLL